MFCVTIQVSMAEEASSASARCAVFGSARHAGCWPRDRHDRRRTSGSLTYVWKVDICWAPGFRVHSPCGPRKSGIPESVEIPAPVSTVTARTPRTHEGTTSSARLPSTPKPLSLSLLPVERDPSHADSFFPHPRILPKARLGAVAAGVEPAATSPLPWHDHRILTLSVPAGLGSATNRVGCCLLPEPGLE